MADLQMAIKRGGDPAKNFAVGEPRFLGDVFKTTVAFDKVNFNHTYPVLYGEQKLIDAVQNSNFNQGKHTVIANGAKQALAAAFYALSHCTVPVKDIFVPGPYWPSFPTLVQAAGCNFHTGILPEGDPIVVSSSPNNPCGKQFLVPAITDIWDAAYACPAYAWNGIKPKARVTIHTASKLFGISGARIGWLTTDDAEIADLAAKYVELTTSGVDGLAQAYIARLLEITNRDKNLLYAPYQEFQDKVQINRENFLLHLKDFVSDWSGSQAGMFMWFQPKDYRKFKLALQVLDYSMVDGVHCGQEGWIRCTLGNSTTDSWKAFEKIAKKLKGLDNA